MPVEVVPPMFNMLLEEVEWAIADKEPYRFSHYLIWSKTYKEIESKLDQEENRSSKKFKKDASADNTFYFHPEDEILHKYAVGHTNFDYTSQGDEGRADSKRAFQEMGIAPQGHMILIERSRFKDAVKALAHAIQPST
jgi:protein BCP1